MKCLNCWRAAAVRPISANAVTVLEHSLRAAWFVQRDGGDDALIAAALLHESRPLASQRRRRCSDTRLDTHHEDLGVDASQVICPPPSSTPFACMWRPSATCVSPSRITWPHWSPASVRASICRAADECTGAEAFSRNSSCARGPDCRRATMREGARASRCFNLILIVQLSEASGVNSMLVF